MKKFLLALALLVTGAVTLAGCNVTGKPTGLFPTPAHAADLSEGWHAVIYVKVRGDVQGSRHALVHQSKEACEAWLETPVAQAAYLRFVQYANSLGPGVEVSDPVCEQEDGQPA
jgi:hypothetical protein